jgi:uncharacterized protein (DUF1330 family)
MEIDMSAYMVFTRTRMLNEQEMAVYSKAVPATLVGHDVKILALYGAHEEPEGPQNDGSVILEFPTVEAAKAWYDGPAYREVREHRFKAAEYQVSLMQGV